MTKLLKIQTMSEDIGVPVRTLRTLFYDRKIPGIRAGHRTLYFELEKVRAAFEKMEIAAINPHGTPKQIHA